MSTTNLAKLNCAEIVIKTMVAQGLDTLYCLPGVQNDDFFDAMARLGTLKPVHTRHEQATAYMALGAALASGKPQSYCVVPGPGFLNTATPLATAQSLCAPILAISGQIFEKAIGRGIGYLHEVPNQLGIMRTLTKWAAHIDGAADAGPKIREAFRQLLSGPPQPVGIECGWDMWRHSAEVVFDDEPIRRQTPAIDEDAVEAAARLLAKAKRPLIMAGGGAQDASLELTALAEMLQAPVTAYRTGLGAIDGRHELSQCLAAGYRLWKDADVVLGVGTRLQQRLDWGTDDKLKVILLDIDGERMGRVRKPDIGVVADAAEGLRALAKAVSKHLGKVASRSDEMRALKASVAEELAPLHPQKAWIDAIREALPEDGILVEELTQVSYASRLLYPVYRPRTYLTTGYQGTLGWGYPTALGAKVAMPGRPVVSVSGDGGFMFGVQELATAVRHKIGVVALIFTDNAYGNVQRMQHDNFEGRVIASDLANPDFVKLGQSFGLRSVRAKDPRALRKAMAEAIKADEPALIEIPVGAFPDPWRFFVRKKLRG
jgi:acetolactate synthase-1/2/3 large subunit